MAKTYRQIWADSLRKQYTKEELIWKFINAMEEIEDRKSALL